MTSDLNKHFTLVFPGDIRDFGGNPLKTETVFGTATGVMRGDALKDLEDLRARGNVKVRLRLRLANFLQRVATELKYGAYR